MPGTYRSLLVWRLADSLFMEIQSLVKTFPTEERYELSAQLRRAALSVPTNIVEGTARFGAKETLQFLRTAWASLAETEYLLLVAQRLNYLPREQHARLDELIARIGGALRGLVRDAEHRSLNAVSGSRRRSQAPPNR
jgi:four helix bundle protein